MSATPVISLIGAGNMGTSLIGGLIKNGHPQDKIWASDLNQERLDQLKQSFGINITIDNKQAIEQANVVIFAIKPQLFAEIAQELAVTLIIKQPLIISIAAGIRLSSIEHWINKNMAIVRAMPNTPALIGAGATALYANQHVSSMQRNLAESILRAVGVTVWVDNENNMDVVTALSGSGPAYFFLVMESLQHAAEAFGLSTEVARLLTLQTALGAAKIAIESGQSLEELRHNVTSKGGTTEKAISVLEEQDIRGLLKNALEAAKLRSEEIAEAMGK